MKLAEAHLMLPDLCSIRKCIWGTGSNPPLTKWALGMKRMPQSRRMPRTFRLHNLNRRSFRPHQCTCPAIVEMAEVGGGACSV